jgi:hypothetical protein
MLFRARRQRVGAAAELLAAVVGLGACDPTIVLGARAGDAAIDPSEGAADEPASLDVSSDAPPPTDLDAATHLEAGPTPDAQATADAGDDAARTLLFSADQETRDLSPWHEGGDFAGGDYQGGGTDAVSTEHAHSGSYAVKFTIDTSDGQDHATRVYRRTAPSPAYYSAWFYLSEGHSSFGWWTVFLFRALTDTTNINSAAVLWDIGFERRQNGDLGLVLFDHATLANAYAPAGNVVSVGKWVHIEAYFDYAPPQSTRITVWQDGAQVIDAQGLGQASSDYIYWAIGNGANGLVPSVSVVYADDAAISTVRLGPGR